MSKRGRKIAFRAARRTVLTVSDVILLALKAVGTALLVIITAGVVFAFIFVMYVKANMTGKLDVTYEEYATHEASVIYYQNRTTGKYEELIMLENEEFQMWIDYDQIPKDMINATVAIEDKRFFEHNGVDWFRTIFAVGNMFFGDSTVGGSSLTQQLIKNVTGKDQVTVARKLNEIFQAVEFEKKYSKEQIIEWYLNIVYYGHRCYGIGAAARYYFGKTVQELSLAETACIVGITNNPSLYDPFSMPQNNARRTGIILDQMYDQGMISEQQLNTAKREIPNLHFIGSFNAGRDNAGSGTYSWYVDALYYDLIDLFMKEKNCSAEIAKKLLLNGGYRIYACIDPEIQAKLDAVYEDVDNLPYVTGSSAQLQSSMVILDPYDGSVVALVGGVGDKDEQGSLILNRATQTTRPPGSSIKPLSAYAPAIEYGVATPLTLINDSGNIKLQGTDWLPLNDTRGWRGVVTLRQALISSINTVSAQLVDKLTIQTSYEFLEKNAGLTTLQPDKDCAYAPLCLGQFSYGVTVKEMASAYSMFVNGGIRTKARLFSQITGSDGQVVYDNEPEQNVAISEKTAYWMTSMLSDAAHYGTGSESYLGSLMPNAGKTGTSGDNKDRWFCGYTPYYVGVVWTGYDQPATMNCSGNPSSQIWKRVMTAVHEGLEYREFTTPEDTWLAPIPGVEIVDYTVRCVSESGALISNEVLSGVAGEEMKVSAPELTNYELISAAEQTITLSDEITNEVVFVYRSTVPVIPGYADNPYFNPGGTVTGPDNPYYNPGQAQGGTN